MDRGIPFATSMPSRTLDGVKIDEIHLSSKNIQFDRSATPLPLERVIPLAYPMPLANDKVPLA